ncbi:MAG TPA: hypothetical protein VE981_08350, partial [Planctomycetota bacterium]|nr:hypothetical protein [Planctomycetota bacterium]
FVPTRTVPRPSAYLIPQEYATVIAKLEHHGIALQRLPSNRSFNGEVDAVVSVAKAASPDVGTMKREETAVTIRREPGRIAGRAGDVLVPTDQVLGTLAVYLLEPESDDGLVRWGYLDAVAKPGAILPIVRVSGV